MFKGWKFVALMFAFMLPMALANAPALFAQSGDEGAQARHSG